MDKEVYESSNLIKAKLIHGRHVCTVENFINIHDSVTSTFSIGEGEDKTEWTLKLSVDEDEIPFPDGRKTEIDVIDTCVYLTSSKRDKVMACVSKMALIETDRKTELYDAVPVGEEKKYMVWKKMETEWNKRIIPVALGIEDDVCKVGDQMTILCEITVLLRPYGSELVKVPECNLLTEIYSLYEDQKFADVVLCAQGVEFHVHKLVLLAQSSVFAAMFDTPMKENRENKVKINDVRHEVLAKMVQFLYTGKAPPDLDDMAPDLLAVSDKYMLDQLKALCEENLVKKLTSENVMELLKFANTHSAQQLKMKAEEYIKANSKALFIDSEARISNMEVWLEYLAAQK